MFMYVRTEKITFDDAPPQQSIAIHTDAVIVCRTSGNPAPEVSWRFKGRRITDGKWTDTEIEQS